MGLYIRRRIPVKHRNTWINVSKSGLSVSKRVGRVTVNSRGSVWVRLLKGVAWRQK
jgi:hypothetical protein